MRNWPKDEDLVRTFQLTRDVSSFDMLYQRHLEKVRRKCLRVTRDTATAQDLAQDIFLLIFERLCSFRHQSSFSTWLHTITRNYCIDHLRTTRKAKTGFVENEWVDTLADWPVEASIDALDAQMAIDVLDVETLLNQLPDHQATLLRLRYEQGLTIREIGCQCQLGDSAVKMRIVRSLRHLRFLVIG